MAFCTAAGSARREVIVPERCGHGRTLAAAAVVLPAVLGDAPAAWAQECRDAQGVPQPPAAQLISVQGEVRVNDRPPEGVLPEIPICPGDVVAVGPDSKAQVSLSEADTPLRLDENSVSRFQAPEEPGSGLVDLTRGALYFLSEVRRTLTVRTPYVTAGVEGTEVYLRTREPGAGGGAGAELIVLEGRVAVTPGSRTPGLPAQTATTGERIEVAEGGAVQRTTLPGGDGPYAALRRVTVGQLSWTLFYPDVLVGDEAQPFPRIREAAHLLAVGQAEEAQALLGDVPDGAGARPRCATRCWRRSRSPARTPPCPTNWPTGRPPRHRAPRPRCWHRATPASSPSTSTAPWRPRRRRRRLRCARPCPAPAWPRST